MKKSITRAATDVRQIRRVITGQFDGVSAAAFATAQITTGLPTPDFAGGTTQAQPDIRDIDPAWPFSISREEGAALKASLDSFQPL